MSGITLATFVKDEENCIAHMIESVKRHVDEIVVVDTGSTDNTISICRDFGARIYEVGFTDFGKIRTLAAHLAKKEWVLMLDADETLTCNICLRSHLDLTTQEAIAIPRKRWLDLEMTKQTELEAYPDWQVRLFKNNPNYVWKRELHEYFDGAPVYHDSTGHLCINHFHDVFKSPLRLAERDTLYLTLAKKAGVTKEGGHETDIVLDLKD